MVGRILESDIFKIAATISNHINIKQLSDTSIPPTQTETQGRLKILGNHLNSKNRVRTAHPLHFGFKVCIVHNRMYDAARLVVS